MGNKVNNTFNHLLEGLFPQPCLLCELPSGRSLPLCVECMAQLLPNYSHCRRCALPLPTAAGGAREASAVSPQCGECLRRPPPFDRVIAPWIYEEHLALFIHRWKYAGQQQLSSALARLWLQATGTPPEVDLLVPEPLHWRRLWQRGFNQAALLARHLRHSAPGLRESRLVTRGVRRVRATASQSGMGAQRRQSNLQDAFTVHLPCD